MLYILAIVVVFLGFSVLDDAAKWNGKMNPLKWFWTLLIGVGFYTLEGERLWHLGFPERWIPISFFFGMVSPFLGILLYYKNGKILKNLTRCIFVFGCWMVTSALIVLAFQCSLIFAMIFSSILVLVFSLPWKKWKRSYRDTKEKKHYSKMQIEQKEKRDRIQAQEQKEAEAKEQEILNAALENLRR